MFLLQTASDLPLKDLLSLIGGGSGFSVLLYVCYLFLNRKIVTKADLDDANARCEEMQQERDEWKTAALRLLNYNERIQNTNERAFQAVDRATALAQQAAGSSQPEANR